MAQIFTHNLFLSYARTPDALLAREVERLLESFHDTLRQGRRDVPALQPLTICVDGSDFSMPPPDEREALEHSGTDVLDIVFRHMAGCRELLVLCSTGAARSTWIDREIRWFLDRRGPQHIRVALTEGDTPWTHPEDFYPRALLDHGFPDRIFYDLRGYDRRRAREWTQVPEFSREIVRLAADLHGRSAGEVYPAWLESELARARSQSLSLVGTSRFETLTGDPGRALLVAFDAHELHPGPETETALGDAYRVTILHHENRREAAQMTGSGPRYLAGRWKQGAVFSKSSPDGRYHVMVTERGKDGPQPPGDVFLISNETLRAVKLAAPDGEGARVEDVAFDRESSRVLVSRYFHLHVYDLLGRQIGSYYAQRHTKSPLHAVAGMLGKYAFVAETKGGLWLVEPTGWEGGYLQITAESHNDAVTAIEIAPDGGSALVVRESGRADIVRLTPDGVLESAPVPGARIQFGGYPFRSSALVATAGADGVVRTFSADGVRLSPLVSSAPVDAALDWVSGAPDGRRLLGVGNSEALFVMDAETGELLRTLEFSDDIDWTSVRSRPLGRRHVEVRPAEPLRGSEPLDAPELTVADVVSLHGDDWLLVEDYRENEYWPKRIAWRVEGAVATAWSEWFSQVEARGPFLWLGNGNCLLPDRGRLLRIPGDGAYVSELLAEGNQGWLATRQGLYGHDGERCTFFGPEGTWFDTVTRVAESLWAWGHETGAHLLQPATGRAIPMGEPFGPVTRVVESAGATWIVLKDKPVHRVEAGRARPWRDVPINDVVTAGGRTWLVGRDRLYRLRGDGFDEVTGFAAGIARAVPAEGRLLVTTDTSAAFLAGNCGPAYLVDPESLAVETCGPHPSAVAFRCGGRWLVGPQTVFVFNWPGAAPPRPLYGLLSDEGTTWVEFEGGDVEFATVGGEGLVLTGQGAFRVVRSGVDRVEGVEGPVHAATGVGGRISLLGAHDVWILGPGAPERFSVGDDRPVRLVEAGGRTWVVTDNGSGKPGALYRLEGSRGVRVRGAADAIGGVAQIGETLWGLTRVEARPGPMLRL